MGNAPEDVRMRKYFPWLVSAGALFTALVYLGTLSFPFVDWDDPGYISENPGAGVLSLTRIIIESGRYVMGNWHPVTMLSYATDLSVFGMDPGGMHLTNLLLHTFNAVLVALFLRSVSGDPLVAVVGMVLWAVHPLRVESVAWISGRKDLLMTLFGMVMLLAWLRWSRKGVRWAYASSLVAFTLACLSKGMAVALVPSIWLIDLHLGHVVWHRRYLLLQLPFILIAIAVGVVTLDAQTVVMETATQHIRAMDRFHAGPANLVVYAIQQVLPIGLNARYAYPLVNGELPSWYGWACYFTLSLIGILVWRGPLRSPVVLGIWFFILNTALVLQWLPVGEAIRADRYTYLAGVGASLVIALAVVSLGRTLFPRSLVRSVSVFVGVLLVWFVPLTRSRIQVWSSPQAVWSDMIAAHPRDPKHYVDRAITYRRQGNDAAAMADLDRAVARAGAQHRPYHERGMYNMTNERYPEAMADLLEVFKRKPEEPGLIANMIFVQLAMGMCDDVERNSTLALSADTLALDLWSLRAACRIERGEHGQAMSDLLKALELDRWKKETWMLMARAFHGSGDSAMACRIHASGLMGDQFKHPYMERMRAEVADACSITR